MNFQKKLLFKSLGLGLILLCSSCVVAEFEAESVKPPVMGGEQEQQGRGPSSFEMGEPVPAVKNFHQINNTYAQLTGVSTGEPNVLSEFQSIKVQLPTTNDPKSVNGFNQIAFLRLAFAYCDKYVDSRGGSLTSKSNEAIVQDLLASFTAVNPQGSPAEQEFYNEVLSISKNEDNLLTGSGLKVKTTKLSCASILASAYVTTM